MADEADIAEKFQELSLQAALAARANAGAKRELEPRGRCYNCDEELSPVEETQVVDGKEVTKIRYPLFCDEYCSGDWEKRKARK